MKAGEYDSVEDVVHAGLEALEVLEAEDTDDPEWLMRARQRWAECDEAAARGDYFEGTPKEIMSRIRARVEKNL